MDALHLSLSDEVTLTLEKRPEPHLLYENRVQGDSDSIIRFDAMGWRSSEIPDCLWRFSMLVRGRVEENGTTVAETTSTISSCYERSDCPAAIRRVLEEVVLHIQQTIPSLTRRAALTGTRNGREASDVSRNGELWEGILSDRFLDMRKVTVVPTPPAPDMTREEPI